MSSFGTWLRVGGWAVIISVVFPYLKDRNQMIAQLWTNRPSVIREQSAFSTYAVKFDNILRNCEDAVLNEELGIAYLSCDPGRDRWNSVLGVLDDPDWKAGTVYVYDYTSPSAIPEPLSIKFPSDHQGATFHPLGITLHKPSGHLYVTNHAVTEMSGPSIDLFQLSTDGLSAKYLKSLRHPLMYTPNSIFPLSEHEILFTNDHKFAHQNDFWLAEIETYLAFPGGSLVYFNHETNEARRLDEIPFANGVAVLNETHLAVASTLVPAIHVYSYEPGFTSVILEQKLRPSFSPDNLKLDADGKLLVAGHPHSIACDVVAKSNKLYNLDGDDVSLNAKEDRKRAPSWVVEWDGNGEGILKDLFVSNEYGTSTTAVRDAKRGVGIVVGLYELGILVFKS